jgi:hypothetical protein
LSERVLLSKFYEVIHENRPGEPLCLFSVYFIIFFGILVILELLYFKKNVNSITRISVWELSCHLSYWRWKTLRTQYYGNNRNIPCTYLRCNYICKYLKVIPYVIRSFVISYSECFIFTSFPSGSSVDDIDCVWCALDIIWQSKDDIHLNEMLKDFYNSELHVNGIITT